VLLPLLMANSIRRSLAMICSGVKLLRGIFLFLSY
jgi:hypothetical protein